MCCKIFTDILVPLLSAIIGGELTLLGVWLTLRDQTKKEASKQKEAVRPYIFTYDEQQGFNGQQLQTYFLELGGSYAYKKDPVISGIIKNTDNGIMILDRVESENNKYYPSCGNVVDKNAIIELVVVLALDGTETLKEMSLFIKDVYGTTYKYEIIVGGTEFKLGKCYEVEDEKH